MTLENTTSHGDFLAPDRKAFLDSLWEGDQKLDHDAWHVWSPVHVVIWPYRGKPDISRLKGVQLLTYEKYKQRIHGHDEHEYLYIMDKSDPQAVDAFNNLVSECNRELEKDPPKLETLDSIVRKAFLLLYGKEWGSA